VLGRMVVFNEGGTGSCCAVTGAAGTSSSVGSTGRRAYRPDGWHLTLHAVRVPATVESALLDGLLEWVLAIEIEVVSSSRIQVGSTIGDSFWGVRGNIPVDL